MSDRSLTATYRLQLHADFTFIDARHIVPYLADLGVSHLYLSPILQAAPGSMHGYDVVDHASVSADLGGRAALEHLAACAHGYGLGLVVDVVPNHMAIPTPEHLNRQVWDVLGKGQASAYAHWFDVDWNLCEGKLGLPVLGDTLDAVLAAGELTVDSLDGDVVLRYHDHVFPVTAASSREAPVAKLLSQQHYLLASWREKDAVLGYRRFFDVDTLIAVRVELDDVFDATHAVLLDLHATGVIDGFRIDHPDGLADPERYLARLADATDGAWVVVEKILEGSERLPSSWATAGTTGYDALSVIQTALVPPNGAGLDAIWHAAGGGESLPEVELAAKRQVVTTLLAPEVARLTRLATDESAPGRDIDLSGDDTAVRESLEELLVHVEVYRAYLRPGTPPDEISLAALDRMVAQATTARPDLAATLASLRDVLTDTDSDATTVRDLVVRFQQVCGPVMAKGVEDTTFYRYNRMLALNEVGGDPSALTDAGPARLHRWAQAQQHDFPTGMTTLSTHDTKRSEDVRARLLALAADLPAWETFWTEISERAAQHRVDGPTSYLLFQTLVGAWPLTQQRLDDYLTKAMREAKQYTTWNDPDRAYESSVLELAADCLESERLTTMLAETVAAHEVEIAAVTLAGKLIALTLPGVPDVYQGCETVALDLVDPDNRRPVNYAALQQSLARLDAEGERDDDQFGHERLADAKLWVTARTLRLRRDCPRPFGTAADYRPIPSSPEVIAFSRSCSDQSVVAAAHTWGRELASSSIELPEGRWLDVLANRAHDGGPQSVAQLFRSLPVALLVRQGIR